MQRKLLLASSFPRVLATVLPNVRPVSPVLAEFEGVDVRRRAVLEGEDQFMTGPVKGAHRPIVLGPDDQILELSEIRAAGIHDLLQMAPVHADEVDGAVNAQSHKIGKGRGEERSE